MAFPTVTAHTGCEDTRDNSLDSALHALAAGADFVEVDVRSTADGIAVLSHDERINTAEGERITISHSTAKELKVAGAGLQLLEPLLINVLEREGRVNLDLKDDTCLAPVADIISNNHAAGRVVLTGCETSRARAAASLMPGVPVYLNTGLAAVNRFPKLKHFMLLRACRRAAKLGCCGLNINYRLFSPDLVHVAHGMGLEISVWTVPANTGFGKYILGQVDNITTKDVTLLASLATDLDFRG